MICIWLNLTTSQDPEVVEPKETGNVERKVVEPESSEEGLQSKKLTCDKSILLSQACEEADDNSGGISIHNIGGVFIVIFIGIGLAIITLGAEYWSATSFLSSSPSSLLSRPV